MRTARATAIVAALLLGAACSPDKSDEPSASISVDVPGGVASVDQAVNEGGPNPGFVTMTLTNGGNCELAYTAAVTTVDGRPWLTVRNTAGSGSSVTGTAVGGGTATFGTDFEVVSTALRPGTYTGTLRVTGTCTANGRVAAGSPALVPVNLTVTAFAAGIAVTPSRVEIDIVTPANEWRSMSSLGGPRRSDHAAVWTGDEMLVWGGDDNFGDTSMPAQGARYDPIADAWSPMAAVGGGRLVFSAVWAGTEMIVWGGLQWIPPALNEPPELVSTRTGSRYTPATNSWSATSGLNAPTARYLHTAVWAGSAVSNASRMIVWGGLEAGALAVNTGAQYRADLWTPVSQTGAPSARYGHVAVWTGSRMIVWGGSSGVGLTPELGDGALYDPIADLWEPMGAAGAPEARSEAVAVWTGSKLIVWGGRGGGTPSLGSGGVYDVATGRWTPTAARTPLFSGAKTAVWTGSRMIVFGSPSGDGTDSGGIYDPVTNTWTALTNAGVPEDRYAHTAVWTGNQMIVWGGHAGPVIYADGAILR